MKEKLIKKLEKEMEQFKDKIRLQGVDYAIDRAYELTVKQEIIDVLSYDKNLSNIEYKSLLSRKNLLEEMYDDWIKTEGNLRADLENCVDESIEEITEKFEKEKSATNNSNKKHKEKER